MEKDNKNLEKELKKWMYQIKKESQAKASSYFSKVKKTSIDDAFCSLGFQIAKLEKKLA